MPQADTHNNRFREHICKAGALDVLQFRDTWLQFTVIDGDLWFRDWHVVEALDAPSAAYAERLLSQLLPDDAVTVLVDRGPRREEREVGGFVSRAGAYRMAEAVRSKARRKCFSAWLDETIPQQLQEEKHGSTGAEKPGSAATARGHAVLPLSRRGRDRAPSRRPKTGTLLAGNCRGA